MASFNSLAMAKLTAATAGGAVETSATGSPIMWIGYLGDTDSGATIAVSASGDIAVTTDGTTADTTVNTTGTIDCSTPGASTNTFGEVAALINASANLCCVLLGVRPEDSTDNTIAVFTETDISTAAYKTSGIFLYGDGAVTPYNTCYAISGFMPNLPENLKTGLHKGDPDTNCYSVLQAVECLNNFSAAGTIYVYSANQTSSTLLWSRALTDNTKTNYGKEGGFMFRSKDGERLIVTMRNDQSSANDYLRITGYTVDVTNKYPRMGYSLTNALL